MVLGVVPREQDVAVGAGVLDRAEPLRRDAIQLLPAAMRVLPERHRRVDVRRLQDAVHEE
jgi:hypothetical protein